MIGVRFWTASQAAFLFSVKRLGLPLWFWTFTTRKALSWEDGSRMFSVFLVKLRRQAPFRGVRVAEVQSRGAIHWHMFVDTPLPFSRVDELWCRHVSEISTFGRGAREKWLELNGIKTVYGWREAPGRVRSDSVNTEGVLMYCCKDMMKSKQWYREEKKKRHWGCAGYKGCRVSDLEKGGDYWDYRRSRGMVHRGYAVEPLLEFAWINGVLDAAYALHCEMERDPESVSWERFRYFCTHGEHENEPF